MPSRPPVAPYLTVTPAAAAITFYTLAFGAVQKAFMPAPDGLRVLHCELEINGGAVMLADMFPEYGKTRFPVPNDLATVSISLEFATAGEVDRIYERATGMGAVGEAAPAATFWGTRFAALRDPFGHRWMLNGTLG